MWVAGHLPLIRSAKALSSIEPGDSDIAEQKIDFRPGLEDGHGVVGVAHLDHVEAGIAQEFGNHFTDENIVFGDQKLCRHVPGPSYRQKDYHY